MAESKKESSIEFIPLKNLIVARYSLSCRTDIPFSHFDIKEINQECETFHQHSFNKIHKLNLLLVDYLVIAILANELPSFLINKSNSIEINKKKIFTFQTGLKVNFHHIISFLLFSAIQIENKIKYPFKIFCTKKKGTLVYLSYFDQKELKQILLEEAQIKITINKSQIINNRSLVTLLILLDNHKCY